MFRSLQRSPVSARALGFILVVSLFGLGVLGCTGSDATTDALVEDEGSTSTSSPRSTVTSTEDLRTVRLGVAAGRRTGQTPIDALINTEQVAGRQFDILRAYSFWDSEFPDLRHEWASGGGRLLHLSINARRTDGSVVPWATIATATEGDPVYNELVRWVERLARYDGPIRVTFHHEADIEPEFGTPEDFVAAWRRFVTSLAGAAPDIETVWVSTAFSLDKPAGELFWPGDDFVDFIGADAFNWYGCRGTPEAWRSPQEVLAPLMTFAANHPGKPLVLAELGSDEDSDDPGRKAAWLSELATLLATDEYERLDTVIFFHNDHDDQSTCDWWIDSTARTADAFAQLAALPLFEGDLALPAPDQCPIIATVTSAPDDLALVDGNGDGRYDFDFGGENRFLGIGDQSGDGADHRLLLNFPALDTAPPDATFELQLRIGERQPALNSAVELRLVDDFETKAQSFSEPGELLEPQLFDATSVGGHYVFDLTGRFDHLQPSTFRLQLATPPPADDGQFALYLGMGEASRSIDRPTLIARRCG